MSQELILEKYLAVEITKLKFMNDKTCKNLRLELWGIYESTVAGYTYYHFHARSYEDLDKNNFRVDLNDAIIECDIHGNLRNVDILDLLAYLVKPNKIKKFTMETIDITSTIKRRLRKEKFNKLISRLK